MTIRDLNKIFFVAVFANLLVFYRCNPARFILWAAVMPLSFLVHLYAMASSVENREALGLAMAKSSLANKEIPNWSKRLIHGWAAPYVPPQ